MKIVGCDLHAKQQTIAMVDTETGEFIEKTLSHEGDAAHFVDFVVGKPSVKRIAPSALSIATIGD
jgi:hypothetical protein